MRKALSTLSKSTTTTRPMTSTSRVVRPRCTSTLSITTWKKSGETSAKSCRKSEMSITSPSSWRCLTRLGMNQLKSNRASSPASEARLVTSSSSPDHCSAKTARGSMVGRLLAPGEVGSWKSTRWPSHWASTTQRPSFMRASAGSGASVRRSTALRWGLALRPRCWAARRRWVVSSASLGGQPIWWARVSGSAATWCRRASRHRAWRGA